MDTSSVAQIVRTRKEEPAAATENTARPGHWVPVSLQGELTGSAAHAGFSGVSAYLGVKEPEAGPESVIADDIVEADAILEDVRLPENRFAEPVAFLLRQPVPKAGRPLRIIRRQSSVSVPPPAERPARSTAAQPRSPLVQGAGARVASRSDFALIVGLIVVLWAGVVGAGTMFFNTPRSGMKVEWR